MGTETLFPPVIPTQGHSNRPTPRLSPLILVQHRRKTRPTRSRTSPCPWPTSLLLSRGSKNSEAPQPRHDFRSGLHLPPRAIGEGAAGYEEEQMVATTVVGTSKVPGGGKRKVEIWTRTKSRRGWEKDPTC